MKRKVKERITKNADGLTLEVCKYDKKGNRVYKRKNDENGNLTYLENFVYDENNNLIKEVYTPTGHAGKMKFYRYNSDNEIEGVTIKDNTKTYKYNSNNDVIEICTKDDSTTTSIFYEYTYY